MIDIDDLQDLKRAADNSRSVICPSSIFYNRPELASWIINLPGLVLYNLFRLGMVIYSKEEHNAEDNEADDQEKDHKTEDSFWI